jgi:hypothetical protein
MGKGICKWYTNGVVDCITISYNEAKVLRRREMKKSVKWIIASLVVLLAAALVFSCASSGGGGGGGSPAGEEAGTPGDLGTFNLRLEDNFLYGDGYQALIYSPELLNGHKIVAGETYTLKITFTVSRDLESDLMIGLVDPTPAANYWKALSWDEAAGIELEKIDTPQKDQVISATITLKTLADATAASPSANSMVFITEGEGRKGVAGSGKLKTATLSFTEFVFTRN